MIGCLKAGANQGLRCPCPGPLPPTLQATVKQQDWKIERLAELKLRARAEELQAENTDVSAKLVALHAEGQAHKVCAPGQACTTGTACSRAVPGLWVCVVRLQAVITDVSAVLVVHRGQAYKG